MVPARQRFEAGDAPGVEIEQRLVGDRQLTRRQRAPQLALQAQAMRHFDVQRGIEQRIARLAVGLGLVHRRIGIAQHLGRRRVAHAAESDADAGAGDHVVAGNLHGLAQRFEQAPCQRHRVLLAIQIFGQDRELVAAQARDDVLRAQAGLNAARHGDQEFVAHGVAQAVVDQFEAVEVEEQQPELALRFCARASEHLRQVLLETLPIGQPGQAVVEGDVLQLGFADFQIAHMAGHEFGFALGGFAGALARGLVGLLLAKVVVQCRQHHRDDGRRHHEHADARLLDREEQQAGHRGAGGKRDADPAEVAEQLTPPRPLVALEVRDGGDQQRVEHEIENRADHARRQQHPRAIQAQTSGGVDGNVQQRADAEHGDASHRRAREAAGPALGGAPRADQRLARRGQRRRLRAVHQQAAGT